jgi:DNA-binding beta-propeller fold protein YncE
MKRLLLIMAGLLFLSGCATARPDQQSQTEGVRAWPPPPHPPRIEYVREVRTHKDVGITLGFWARMRDMLLGEDPASILKPYGVHVDGGGRIFVVDTEQAALHVMDRDARSYRLIGGQGTGVFVAPVSVTGDNRGTVYVTDPAAGKIFALSHPDYTPRLFTDVRLSRPTGIAYNARDDRLYVSDTSAHQIVAFDSLGTERQVFGKRGVEPLEFNFPTDLAIDRQWNLMVTDALNNRIQVLDKDLNIIHIFGRVGKQPGYLGRPKGVAADSDGNLYIADAQQDMVQIFAPDGTLLLTFGETGSGPGQFWMPAGLFIDANDTIYVSDSYNRRIQIFRYLKASRFEDDPVVSNGAARKGPLPAAGGRP